MKKRELKGSRVEDLERLIEFQRLTTAKTETRNVMLITIMRERKKK